MILLVALGAAHAQTDSARTPMHRYAPAVGLDVGYGWRSGTGEHGPDLAVMYRDALGTIDLEAILYQRWFNNDTYSLGHFGFGFGFLVFMPGMFDHVSGRAGLEPKIGVDFTVWTTTLGIGIPVGAEYYLPLVASWDASLGASVEPQFNLNTDKNTVVFDLRIGIRYH
ncbi:MAG: hypothetical protein JSS75_08770 [Bacteroidetes bacterium]|nr:hypothetical protein [Bacteroidota bacterium]